MPAAEKVSLRSDVVNGDAEFLYAQCTTHAAMANLRNCSPPAEPPLH
jgi:hypothetical protein